MPVTLNNKNSNDTGGSASTTLTVSLTINAGSDKCLYVGVAVQGGDQSTISSITWNTSEALTQIATDNFNDGVGARLWRLKNPTAGSFNVVITNSASFHLAAVAIALDGVDQTTTERTAAADGGDSAGPTVTLAASQSGDFCLDCMARLPLEDDTATAGAGQTSQQQDKDAGFENIAVAVSTETATGASTVMDWTLSSGRQWSIAAAALIPAAGGGGGRTTKNTRSAPLGMEIGMNWRS